MPDVPTILPMAVITVATSAALWVALLWAYAGRTWRYVAFVPLGLPLSAIVNLAVKAPLGTWVGAKAGIEPGLGAATPVWFLLFLFALAPVFEELIKLVPTVLPSVRNAARVPDGAFWTGMAIGIGFGLGEAAYLAWQIGASGAYEQYPWYAFTGFLGERLVVVFVHGFMTAVFLRLVALRRPLVGFLAAAGIHALINAGAMLFQLGIVPSWVAGVEFVLVLIGVVVIFDRIRPRLPKAEEAAEAVYYTTHP